MYANVDVSDAVNIDSLGVDNQGDNSPNQHNQFESDALRVTVVLATHNGGIKLRRMLEALTHSTLHKSRWKIVAVDNNSTDDTLAVMREYEGRLPLQILSETRPGKGHALNAAFRHIKGDLTIITDDDVLPEPDWLEQYLRLADQNPDYDMFSGLIEPEWEKQPEPWVLHWVDPAPIFALNQQVAPGPISARHIFGPNSAFRTSILPETYTVESMDLGPDAQRRQYAMGGDTAFAAALEKKGHRALHSRDPRVRHIIPQAYVDRNWILRRAERFGKGVVHFYPHRYVAGPKICGVQVSLLVKLAMSWIAVQLAIFLPENKKRWDIFWDYRVRKGSVQELFSRHQLG